MTTTIPTQESELQYTADVFAWALAVASDADTPADEHAQTGSILAGLARHRPYTDTEAAALLCALNISPVPRVMAQAVLDYARDRLDLIDRAIPCIGDAEVLADVIDHFVKVDQTPRLRIEWIEVAFEGCFEQGKLRRAARLLILANEIQGARPRWAASIVEREQHWLLEPDAAIEAVESIHRVVPTEAGWRRLALEEIRPEWEGFHWEGALPTLEAALEHEPLASVRVRLAQWVVIVCLAVMS